MRLAFPGGARPDPWDRNPVSATQSYSGATVAPHSSTVRWTYTVPTGRKALVSAFHISVRRAAAATTASTATAFLMLNGTNVFHVTLVNNTVDATQRLELSAALYLTAGDELRAVTLDSSTGGYIDYNVVAVVTEFDA